uniref:Uncharacterized protein n=1 Tax=Meloidogyne enterolobii TaxID=390850 RepID=A0A6V7W8V1_MELEN|nr:unnamed protein product [Meloidogyne enterolobii]
MDPEIVLEIEPEIVREIVLEMEREMDHPEIVLEIESEMEDEIESAPQNPINEPPEIDEQQQTNNSIITATTPLTNNDNKVDSADQKNFSGSRKCYLLLLLFVIYYYLYDSPTLEECDRTFELDENFDFYQCKCVQDLRICKISLVILQTCNTTSPAKYLETKQIVKCCILNALLLINIVVKLECVNALMQWLPVFRITNVIQYLLKKFAQLELLLFLLKLF